MTVDEAIKISGTTNILAKGSTKKAQALIENDEEVIYALNTNVLIVDTNKTLMKGTKGMFSLTNGLNGVVVVTNKRVIFCSSTLGNSKIKQILIQDITSMDENINGLTKMGQFRIQGITETFVINIYKSKIVDDLRNAIYKCQEMQSKVHSETNTIINSYQSSNADEILKFKQLLDEGIITQSEFERKKQELLK